MVNSINVKNIQVTFFGEVDGFGFASEHIEQQIQANDGEELEILINSPGGAVFEGINIASLLQRRNGHTITTATGLAASIATVILMAGDTVQMDKDAFIMIHDAWAFEAGDSKEMRKTARLLDKISDKIADIYTDQVVRAGKMVDGDREKTKDFLRQKMRAETWLNAEEALKLGLIDKIVDAKHIEEEKEEGEQVTDFNAKFYNKLTKFNNTPTTLLNKYKMCDCKSKINNAIEEMVNEETNRAAIVKQLASAAGISEDTINAILAGDIDCPPLRRLEGFASVLDISMKTIVDSGTSDGCNYGGETETENNTKNMNEKKTLFQKLAVMLGFKATVEDAPQPEAIEVKPSQQQEEETKEEPMTNEQMIEALKNEGFSIEAPKAEVKEVENKEFTELQAKLAKMEKEQEALKAQLKDEKFKAAGKSADGAGEQSKEDKRLDVGQSNRDAFDALANMARNK